MQYETLYLKSKIQKVSFLSNILCAYIKHKGLKKNFNGTEELIS
jgi:hypothetical protein